MLINIGILVVTNTVISTGSVIYISLSMLSEYEHDECDVNFQTCVWKTFNYHDHDNVMCI